MTKSNEKIEVGDSIRHAKRNSRYRVFSRLTVPLADLQDEARMWLSETDGSSPEERGLKLQPIGSIDPARTERFRLNVMVQIDEETRLQQAASGQSEIDVYAYMSLDHAGQNFVRPVCEFTDSRFYCLSDDHPASWTVQSLFPSEQRQVFEDFKAVKLGADAEGTLLEAVVRGYSGKLEPSSVDRTMIAAHLSEEFAGMGIADKFYHEFSPEETLAIEELCDLQDLSPSAVVRQALRLYQSQVKGPLPGPVTGCMGD
ncbi:hypothetical protein AB9K35_17480 [Leisingera sp. XS_AS12]|uniref:hypothetical protein n=1 Tax=Leisingera sp. XS_AS12 TaxID=3241294 RepID=UPI003514326A